MYQDTILIQIIHVQVGNNIYKTPEDPMILFACLCVVHSFTRYFKVSHCRTNQVSRNRILQKNCNRIGLEVEYNFELTYFNIL